ncbi:MAG: tripartite tricarboxylate transporter substrate binding protein, partial [Planctomycetales bacterium]|nr:tripartite tricarboxylate transporter substrate binding protein [Planctomycetales bacterium]
MRFKSAAAVRVTVMRTGKACSSRLANALSASPFARLGTLAKWILLSWVAGVSIVRAESNPPVFPAKPIKLIVYMNPGGLVDITARKFVAVAAKYTDATFVVENKQGAGGIVAIQKVQRQKADGYTLLACTKSNISKVVSCDVESYLANFHWLAMLMADPECVITHRDADVTSWAELVADARARPGEQLWLGPENGGLDHVTALKIWVAAGIQCRWIPCASGGEALNRLIGKQGYAYVGNPGETLANPMLTVAAVCAPARLQRFPDAPTFAELGVEGVEKETMWRGIAMKKGSPEHVIEWYEDLFRKVSSDPDWRTMWEKSGIDVQYVPHAEFSQIVEQDRLDYRRYLTMIGLVSDAKDYAKSWWVSPITSLIAFAGSVLLCFRIAKSISHGQRLIVGAVVGIAVTMMCHTFVFPHADSVGPATIPRLYVLATAVVSLLVLVDRSHSGASRQRDRSSSKGVTALEIAAMMAGYVIAVVVVG